ncbi:MAG: hypothetical protein ABS68_12085 [Niastella sp. SCN 39-18]|nr:trypsin-like peptidase domain-containing protein [Sphingobacteriales bacterium]ODT51699.1 MAG: hypothetical protein ABS68_12085 [Niastella sp. SCN 39-18]OJW09727.1 MAG: serine protease [Sphingobacteriales bacterium 39-19]
MFVKAIERVSDFTRPIHSILRIYPSNNIIPGAATLFFVNENGYAITCKHVAESLLHAENINQQYIQFRNETKAGKNLQELEAKYKYGQDHIIQIKNNFVDSIDSMTGFTTHIHPTLDLAIIKFNDFKKTYYKSYAHFAKNDEGIKQGKFLCRLGFPFPEFNNYRYNVSLDDIEWLNTGNTASPRFPIEGMITRFLGDAQHGLYGIEMSTPGLRGQSGGPLFNEKGTICGMQFNTKHLHLGFDMEDKEIWIENKQKKVSDYSFIHLGQCIHANTIKAFLKQHQVKYYEE